MVQVDLGAGRDGFDPPPFYVCTCHGKGTLSELPCRSRSAPSLGLVLGEIQMVFMSFDPRGTGTEFRPGKTHPSPSFLPLKQVWETWNGLGWEGTFNVLSLPWQGHLPLSQVPPAWPWAWQGWNSHNSLPHPTGMDIPKGRVTPSSDQPFQRAPNKSKHFFSSLSLLLYRAKTHEAFRQTALSSQQSGTQAAKWDQNSTPHDFKHFKLDSRNGFETDGHLVFPYMVAPCTALFAAIHS